MWSIKPDIHSTGAVVVYEREGVPVLVTHAGRYPQAVSSDGRTTRDTPHVLITVVGGSHDGEPFYTGLTVHAIGGWYDSRRRALQVWTDIDYADSSRREASPSKWVAMGETKVADAIAALSTIDHQYEIAGEIVARAKKFQSLLPRADYERACAACAVEVLSDTECQTYGVRYGHFSFPEYSAQHVVKMHLAALRLKDLDADQKAAAGSATTNAMPAKPIPQGQLWEPCDRCGAEPIYMPLHLCDGCWPK